MALNSNFRTLTADNIEGIVEDRNYLKSSFENGTITGWTEVAVALTSGLPTGTPTISATSASSLALSATSVTPLSGSRSLLVDVPSALTAGHGFISDEFTLDRMDLGKVLTVSFDYERVTGTYNFSGTLGSQTWMVYLYDATAGGATWIQPAGFLGMNQSSGPGRVRATFQSSVTAGQKYRVAVIASQAAAGASSIEFDNFSCSRQTAPIGPVVTDTVNAGAITIGATVTAPTKGTRTADSVSWMRIGDSAYFSYQYNQTAAGTAGSGEYLISLPSGMSFDSNKVSFYTGGLVNFSALVPYGLPDAWFGWGQSSGTNSYGLIIPYDSTRFRVAFEYVSASGPVATGGLFWGSSGNELSYARVSFNATFQVPISGWSSNVQLSNDTDTRVVAFRATRTGSQSFPNVPASPFTVVQFNSIKNDTHGAWDSVNYRYIIPVSGYYDISARFLLQFGTSTAEIVAYLVVDGTAVALQQDFKSATTSGNQGVFARFLWNLNAGQAVQVRMYQANSGGGAINGVFELGGIEHGAMYVNRLSGPSVVAASDSVSAIYQTSAGQSIPHNSATVVVFGTKIFDSHSAMNASTGVFTCPVSGEYQLSAAFYFSTAITATATDIQTIAYKNGVAYLGVNNTKSGTAAAPLTTSGTIRIRCNAGDTLSCAVLQANSATTAQTLLANAAFNWVAISRVGN